MPLLLLLFLFMPFFIIFSSLFSFSPRLLLRHYATPLIILDSPALPRHCCCHFRLRHYFLYIFSMPPFHAIAAAERHTHYAATPFISPHVSLFH
jgi:hypothetical protein